MKGWLLLVALVIGVSYNALSQDDDFIPLSSVTDWKIATGDLSGSGEYWIEKRADTTIYGMTMSRYDKYVQYDGFSDVFIYEINGGRQVYLVDTAAMITGNDEGLTLLYDFTLELDDIAYFKLYSSERPFKVEKIDTVSSHLGRPLKRWTLRQQDIDIQFAWVFTYTETIGNPQVFDYQSPVSDPTFGHACAFIECQPIIGDCSTPERWRTGGETTIDISICEGETFMGLDQEGLHELLIDVEDGCDSISRINLSIARAERDTSSLTICNGGTVEYLSKIYESSGTYADTTYSEDGCIDRLVTLYIDSVEPTTSSTSVDICAEESYTWRDEEYTVSGTYVDEMYTDDGCLMSSDTLILAVASYQEETREFTVCGDLVVVYNGTVYDAAGTYVDTTYSEGCVALILTIVIDVIEPETVELDSTVCASSFTFNGITLNQSGNYSFDIYSNECLSQIVLLDLTLMDVVTEIDTTICMGESYLGLSSPGTYEIDTVDINTGCSYTIEVNLEVDDGEDCMSSSREVRTGGYKIFPNPAEEYIEIKGVETESVTGVNIYDLEGRLVKEDRYSGRIDISLLKPGVYMLEITSRAGRTYMKLMKQ